MFYIVSLLRFERYGNWIRGWVFPRSAPLGESTDQVGTGRRGYPGCHGGARWMNEWESQRAPQMGPVRTGLGQVFYQCY